MDDLKRMALFAEIARAGSLSAAARHLRISTSAVSQQLRLLEDSFGVILVRRSNRKLSLTDAGARFAVHCREMVEVAERAREQLSLARDTPAGELRISLPLGLTRHVAPALEPLLARHPSLKLRLEADDGLVDLIDERIDLALRAGRMKDSSWVAQPLCRVHLGLCATPGYLKKAGRPRTLEDLPGHEWLAVLADGRNLVFDLQGPSGASHAVQVTPRLSCNNQLTLHQMCAAGLGITRCILADVEDDLRLGRLEVLLPEWRLTPIQLWAVTPRRSGQPAKVRHALDAIRAYLRRQPGISA
ncbi:LysR family transcriptional regulator [Corallococcus macrosporus]|uniref:LysR family transcriptional regulator n=1 Tax=Myxococcus fulvus (strain ATCC BAA-855 / HW-1) TaxID=483219 RepID=F8CPE6_MYXFH|nr:LysR family transcriptional regulator [Corallococcus macrosporus]AEI67908.1 LysR family transcriptional regulator [Corallococcus macrosporus]